MSMRGIKKANKAYEEWFGDQLNGELVEDDLESKHDKMKEDAFTFLRATYWRWAEIIPGKCPDLMTEPWVLAVGDIHLENYGSWRDLDGRLIWGINDFDEAAEMPYTLDLVRLAASAMLADELEAFSSKDICKAILEGHQEGLRDPRTFVLDENYTWLFERLTVSGKRREKFWKKMNKIKSSKKAPAPRYAAAINLAMPEGVRLIKLGARDAGVGSLGRPRWVAIAEWNGGRVVREAKALVPSAWTRVFPPKSPQQQISLIAAGDYRAPDPWYRIHRDVVVRRLSPNSRKIEIEDEEDPKSVFDLRLLHAMGHELANVQHGVIDKRKVVMKDLARRKGDWLLKNATIAKDLVEGEFQEWKKT